MGTRGYIVDLCVYVFRRGYLSVCWVVICYASDVIEYNKRTPEPFNAPLHMKQYTTSTPV